MKPTFFIFLTKLTTVFIFCLNFGTASAQDNDFWDRVLFGGSFGLGFGSGYTDISLAPGALYQFNEKAALGANLLGSYVHQKAYYDSAIYGGSAIGLYNPLPQLQLSVEVEELRVNLDLDEQYARDAGINYTQRNFWNTALFFGVGYRMQNVTVGLRYNVLYKEKDMVYSDSIMPFVRVYF